MTAHEAFARALEEAAMICQREWQGANALYKSQVGGELMRAIRAIPNPYPASENAAPELFAKARRWLMQKRRK